MVSLDVFRGVTIAAMILVNNPGSWDHVYAPLDHAEWNGWTPTDLIFPFFLFIVGVSLSLSLESRARRTEFTSASPGAVRRSLAWHVIRRSAVIFAIGLFLNGLTNPDLHTIRIMGVLQRIALCYLAAGLLYLAARRKESGSVGDTRTRVNVPMIAGVAVVLLAGYWALMTFVPVPGYGAGHLGADDNLAAYVDRALLGGHVWSESKTWDPEGLLSTLPAIASVLIGILAGEWLRSGYSAAGRGARKIAGLLAAGGALMLAGLLLNPYFPINKSLWTSTYVLFSGGFAMLLLALCYWVVDVRRSQKWAQPFLVFGMNAILAFSLASLITIAGDTFELHDAGGQLRTVHDWIYNACFSPFASPNNASLAFAVCFVLLIFVLLWPFYREKLFVRV